MGGQEDVTGIGVGGYGVEGESLGECEVRPSPASLLFARRVTLSRGFTSK